MKEFDALIAVMEKLLSPEGCEWDRKQTFTSLQPYVLEEAHEVIEAVDLNDDAKIIEELGDLLLIIVFYGKLAEKQKRFALMDIVNAVKEKLIRRHPHVFGEIQARTMEEVKENWDKIKKKEKGPQGLLDGIPPTLPSVARAQKVLERIDRRFPFPKAASRLSEEQLGQSLLSLILAAHQNGLNAESALRRELTREEERFRQKEKS